MKSLRSPHPPPLSVKRYSEIKEKVTIQPFVAFLAGGVHMPKKKVAQVPQLAGVDACFTGVDVEKFSLHRR